MHKSEIIIPIYLHFFSGSGKVAEVLQAVSIAIMYLLRSYTDTIPKHFSYLASNPISHSPLFPPSLSLNQGRIQDFLRLGTNALGAPCFPSTRGANMHNVGASMLKRVPWGARIVCVTLLSRLHAPKKWRRQSALSV